MNASKPLLFAIATAILAGAIGGFLLAKKPGQAQADTGAKTERAAAAAGAQVAPTEPKLRVEPK